MFLCVRKKKTFKLLVFYFYFTEKYSAIGPNVKAGKNDKAATIRITAKTNNPKVEVSVFKVPLLSGMYFFEAKIPAIATGPMIGK